MIREHVLTISTLVALVALSGVAQAAPRNKDKSYRPNQAQTESDWYHARAMQQGVPPAQIVHEGTSRQVGCRYQYSGGPKNPASC
jgi:hypothetical protein